MTDLRTFISQELSAAAPNGVPAQLGDDELVARIEALERGARATLADLLEHLGELEHRRLDLRLGYSSLYDYCQRGLLLSPDEAYRRVTAARWARRMPAILPAIAAGDLHLTSVLLLKPHLTADNAAELIQLARGRTKDALVRELRTRFPQADAAESLRRLTHGSVAQLSATRYRLQATIDQRTRDQLERALDLTSHTNPSRALEPALARALELLVAELERTKRSATKRAASARATSAQATDAKVNEPSRRPPRAARRVVFQRDGDRCSYVAPDGRRCEERAHLEVDHRVPWALRPSNDASGVAANALANLRVLCRAHNRWLAEEWFGRERVSDAMAARRKKRVG